MNRTTKLLKVRSPEGEKIYAIITPSLETIHIEVRPLKVVQDDSPPFAQNGVIRFNVERKKYKEVIEKLTNYIESLFLRAMDKETPINEDIYSSIGAHSKPRGTKKTNRGRSTRIFKGERDLTSVHSSARGDEQTESLGGGDSKDDVAEVSDTSSDGEDQEGN